jgi:hypothetical protein
MRGQEDWVGNSNSIYKTLGASNHTDKDREINDYYATEPKAIDLLCQVEDFSGLVWEPACGGGHMSEALKKNGYAVYSTDLINRGYGEAGIDFLMSFDEWERDIITNPPYKYATEFVYHALEIVPKGSKVAMFLKLQFLEGKKRKELFIKHPPKTIYVSSSRLLCAKNGKFQDMIDGGGSAVAYAWYIWEKGYQGQTVIQWIN